MRVTWVRVSFGCNIVQLLTCIPTELVEVSQELLNFPGYTIVMGLCYKKLNIKFKPMKFNKNWENILRKCKRAYG